MAPKSPLGFSDFREIRESGAYYIDKSNLISQLLASGEKVLLLPRPRRFGKTLNMTMLQAFFGNHSDTRRLFADLAVARDPVAMAHLNRYPTLFLSFKDLDHVLWVDSEKALKARIGALFHKLDPLLRQVATAFEKQQIQALIMREADMVDYAGALLFLTDLLHRQSGQKVVLLIDEYDNPLHEAYRYGYYRETISFMRSLLGAVLKDNIHLERAVVTGIMRVGKESIYSGLNHLAVYSLLDNKFASSFGFTESEVQNLLKDWGLTHRLEEVQSWYNGYHFADQTLYNPWSILSMAARGNEPLKAYWINTSSNDLIRALIAKHHALSLTHLETLMRGGTVGQPIQDAIALADLAPSSVWSLLLFTGYLTSAHWDAATNNAQLRIPNLEVRSFFQNTITQWLGSETQVGEHLTHLIEERFEVFTRHLARMIASILSYQDTREDRGEWVYHVFLLGLLANLPGYQVRSNRESGYGRYDLALLPNTAKQSGFIFEFKTSDHLSGLEKQAESALAQIETQDYAEALRALGVEKIIMVGVSFYGKRVALATSALMLPSGKTSPVQTFQAGQNGTKEVLEGPSHQLEGPPLKKKRKGKAVKDDDADQTLVLAGRIQQLQELKGDAVLPLSTLKGLSLDVLETILKGLKT